jgi:hypothetical protein
METHSIEIDFEVYKMIEMERRSFSDSQNNALRRLLKLPEKTSDLDDKTPIIDTKRSWSSKGVILPHGTKVKMQYRGQQYFGEIIDGAWIVEGKSYISPSAAASGSAVTKDGQHPVLGGWKYWYVRRPSDADFIIINELRR